MIYDQPASAMVMVAVGELKLNFEKTADGIILLSLLDTVTGNELLASKLNINFAEYGIKEGKYKIRHVDENGFDDRLIDPSILKREIEFLAHSALAWEIEGD